VRSSPSRAFRSAVTASIGRRLGIGRPGWRPFRPEEARVAGLPQWREDDVRLDSVTAADEQQVRADVPMRCDDTE